MCTAGSPPALSLKFLPDFCSRNDHSFPAFGSGGGALPLPQRFSLSISSISRHENWCRDA